MQLVYCLYSLYLSHDYCCPDILCLASHFYCYYYCSHLIHHSSYSHYQLQHHHHQHLHHQPTQVIYLVKCMVSVHEWHSPHLCLVYSVPALHNKSHVVQLVQLIQSTGVVAYVPEWWSTSLHHVGRQWWRYCNSHARHLCAITTVVMGVWSDITHWHAASTFVILQEKAM